MSFYKNLLAAVAALVITSPVFADDTATQTTTSKTVTTTNATATDASQSMNAEKLNLNKATGKELVKIKGINAAKARAIITYRKKHGSFKSVDDLSKVKSLRKLKANDLKKIEDQLSI